MVESRYGLFSPIHLSIERTNRYLIHPPVTPTQRLKTGAVKLKSRASSGRAEFFALPASRRSLLWSGALAVGVAIKFDLQEAGPNFVFQCVGPDNIPVEVRAPR